MIIFEQGNQAHNKDGNFDQKSRKIEETRYCLFLRSGSDSKEFDKNICKIRLDTWQSHP